jgi:chromosome segregation ATPase
MRHPRSCNLFFRSSRGCHRQSCSHRHLATQEDPTVLVAREIVAGDDPRFDELNMKIVAQQTQMSELHARLAAQEILKLGCKQGNTEASFKRLLETQDIKHSGEIGCLDAQVQRNKKTMKELKPPSTEVNKELFNLKSEFTELKTNVNTTMQKVVDEKLEAQKTQILDKTKLRDTDMISRLNSVVDTRLKEYTDIIRKQVSAVNNEQKEQIYSHLNIVDVKVTKIDAELNDNKNLRRILDIPFRMDFYCMKG